MSESGHIADHTRALSGAPRRVLLSRESMPWTSTGEEPDMDIVLACKKLIDTICPTYWVIENVRGAIKWFRPFLGEWREHHGPFYLWGDFPALGRVDQTTWRPKENRSSAAAAERAKIPYSLSLAVARACEAQEKLL